MLANWHHLRSPYGPLFTWLSEALVAFGAHGWLWAWKVVVLACGVATVALVGAIAARLGVSRQRAIAGFGLSPLLLIAEVGGLHNDVPAVLCLVAAAWCLVRGRDADAPWWSDPAAGVLAVTAAGIKPSFAIVVGMVVLGARHRPRAIAAAGVAALGVGLVTLLVYGGALPDIGTQERDRDAPERAQPARSRGRPRRRRRGRAVGGAGGDHRHRGGGDRRGRGAAPMGADRDRDSAVLRGPRPAVGHALVPDLGAAVHRDRPPARPRPRGGVATCWLVVGGLPQLPGILHAFGYYPTRLATGLANHREFVRLVR